MRRFDIEVGRCSRCRGRVQGRHHLQTSDALGAAAVQPGPGLVSLVVELHTGMGVPLAKVARLLRTRFGLEVTARGLVRLLHRTARDATPVYRELCRQIRNAPVVTPDDTSWRVGAVPFWLWRFVTPETTVYAICPGREFNDAATVLGTDYAGVLVRDGWQVYRCYKGSLHQSCINHLPQRCEELQRKHPYSPRGPKVKAVLQAGLHVRDRCRNGELTRHGLDSLRGRLGRLVDAPPPLKEATRFAKHLASEFPAVFLFLRDPSIDATNWRAEQAIRPAVVIRKVCGGNRTRKGADTQQVLSTVVRTALHGGAYRPPARPRPAHADGRDVARPRARHSQGFRAPAAARVPGMTAALRFQKPAPFPRLGAAARHAPIPRPRVRCPMGPKRPAADLIDHAYRPTADGLVACDVRPPVVVAIAMNPTRQPSRHPRDSKIPTPSS